MPARAALESLLRDRKLDVTLTTARPWTAEPEDRMAATGIADIDDPLGGGLRRGQVSEILGPRSTGRTSVLCRIFAAATSRGEVVALVDTCDRFDPSSAAESGVDLTRLLWIRERGDGARGLKALNLVLQAGGFGVVAFDLADVTPRIVRDFPHTTWMRLARIIEGSQTTLVLLGAGHIARSPGGVSVSLQPDVRSTRGRWSVGSDRARVLSGVEITCDVRGAMCDVRTADGRRARTLKGPHEDSFLR